MTDTELQAEVERLTAKLNDALTIATLNERRLTGRLAKAEAVVDAAQKVYMRAGIVRGTCRVNDSFVVFRGTFEGLSAALAAYDAATRSDGGER